MDQTAFFDLNSFDASVVLLKTYFLTQVDISASNSGLWGFTGHANPINYKISHKDQTYISLDVLNAHSQIKLDEVFLAIEFTPSNTNFKQTYRRVNYLELLFGLGSVLFMLRSMSNGLVSNLSRFSIDNSMIRKLFSKSKHPEDDMKAY